VIRTGHLPAGERFECWHEHIAQVLAPVKVTSDDPGGFRAEMRSIDLGVVMVSSLAVSSCDSHRTPELIRRSDPDTLQLVCTTRGRNSVAQDRRYAWQEPSDLVLYHTSRPFHVRAFADEDAAEGVMVVIPRALIPLPLTKVDRLTCTAFSGREGIGALLSGYLAGLTAGAERYRASDRPRLGTILMDLLASLLAHHLDSVGALPPETRQRALLERVHAFIQRHLGDPGLSPGVVAAAHGVSVRSLQRLFRAQDATVAGWIRDRRLDRCRRDLADPLLWDRPIHAVAARWGFTDAAHFSRAFRAAHGIGPQDYRRLRLSLPGRDSSESKV
jgi:AraC-like DNA-binding protein